MNEKMIYLDYAASTPILPEVSAAMQPFFSQKFGNPSSIHSYGRQAREAVESARENIALVLHSTPNEIIFTGSGTESDLLAIRGVAFSDPNKKHVITTQIEHPAVLTACEMLHADGFEITYLPVSRDGLVDSQELKRAIRTDTAMVSIIYANNEIGTIQNIKALTEVTNQARVPFHTDACQAAGACSLDAKQLGVDLMSINGSKIYGPKGVGALYVNNQINLIPIMPGGGQETGRRGGTENVPAIVGLATAITAIENVKSVENKRITDLREVLTKRLLQIKGITLTGHPQKRLPNNVHVIITGIDGQTLVGLLDQRGILCSSSSACASASPEPSHVLLALGLSYEQSFQGVRFSLGKYTTLEDVEITAKTVADIVNTWS